MAIPSSRRASVAALTVLLLAFVAVFAGGCGDDGAAGGETSVATSTDVSAATGTASTVTTSGTDSTAPQGPSDSEQINAAVEAFLVSSASDEVCRELVTAALLRSAYGDEQGCLEGRGRPTLAASAEIDEFDVSGSEVQVIAVPEGGLYDGSEVEFTIVSEDGVWRIDAVKADIPVGP